MPSPEISNDRRVILKVGYACNNACTFCHSSCLTHLGALKEEEIRTRIVDARRIGARTVLFSGGEPTIRSDLVELVRSARKEGMGFGLVTNARMLSYRPLLEKLLKLGLSYVYMSLHGPEAAHDATTRSPGSFKQAVSALRMLAGVPGLQLTCNTVVTNHNLEQLDQVVDVLAPLDRGVLKFSAVEPKGGADQDREQIPNPADSARRVGEALDYALLQGMSYQRLGVDGFPHCLDSRFARLQTDFFSHGIMAIREVDEKDYFPIDYGNMSKPEVCRGCLIGDNCRATFDGIYSLHGTRLLRPVTGGLSNSFNYYPLPAGGTVSGHRTLDLQVDGQRNKYWTDTGDFSDQQVLEVRDQLEQLYIQQDSETFVDDFQQQLRKLKKTGDYFSVVSVDLFGEADARVRQLLTEVEGKVLDVGCGQTRYGDLLRAGLDSSRLEYVAVDPVPGDEAVALGQRTNVELHAAGIEEVSLEKGSFDWVLVLRSHNHLADLWTAYSKIIGALAWGGHLLVVDNVPFGLVRPDGSREVIAEIRGDGIVPEHLRNHGGRDCKSFLSRFPLQLIEEQHVTPDTANQWVLLYRKLWPSGIAGVDTFRSD